MISIHTNLSNLIAQDSLKGNTNKLNLAVERMSSGYKINHAKDNAANYSISTNMTTKLGAYQVAEDNVSAGLDLIATASETLSMMQDKVSRLQALSIQARNGTYGAQSLDAINTEARSLISEILRTYNSSKYDDIQLYKEKPDLPQAKPEYNWFIEDPVTYSDEQVDNMTKLETINPSTKISSGTYSISSLEELIQFRDMSNSGKITGGEFVLGADIDLDSIENWTPIRGTFYTTVVFNGNGHIINNLKINTTNEIQGFFSEIKTCIIKNIALTNMNINADSHSGGLVGYSLDGDIINCYTTGQVNGRDDYVGGLVADTYGEVVNCYSTTRVAGNNNTSWIGGLIGCARADVINCFATGDASGYATNMGGLIGLATNGNIVNCYANGNVQGAYWCAGLIGQTLNTTLSNCYATGDIEGTSYSGGLVSKHSGTIVDCYATGNIKGTNYVGGLVGQSDGDISKSYSTGNIIGNSNIGSFVGQTNGLIKDCYTTNQDIKAVNNLDSQGVKIISSLSELGLGLQVGIDSNISSRININTRFDFDLTGLMNGIEADSSLEIINNLMKTLDEKQTEYGAVQNRLESALESIGVNIQNLASARSTIRDADMAELSSTYVKQQILQQASSTLLAQTNNLRYENVLGLLYGIQ